MQLQEEKEKEGKEKAPPAIDKEALGTSRVEETEGKKDGVKVRLAENLLLVA